MEVDYRAVAKGALLAEDGGQMWMATEAGMILKLVP
jgi:succinylglutamate desuccinylase